MTNPSGANKICSACKFREDEDSTCHFQPPADVDNRPIMPPQIVWAHPSVKPDGWCSNWSKR